MAITDRMLIGAIANNPATFDGAGEYRCCRTCEQIFYTSAKQPDHTHDEHDWFALPSLNPMAPTSCCGHFSASSSGGPRNARISSIGLR